MTSNEAVLEVIHSSLIAANASEIVKKYDEYAINYDKDMEFIGYSPQAPKYMAELCLKHLFHEENAKVLDVGCGTGIIGKHLRNLRFAGTIHGIDGSQGMVDEAEKLTGVYNRLVCKFLNFDADFGFAQHSYDAVVSSGCFSASHFDPELVKMLGKYAKINGVLIFNTRANAIEYRTQLEKHVNEMTNNGIWEKINVCKVPFCDIDYKNLGTLSYQYCFKRIK